MQEEDDYYKKKSAGREPPVAVKAVKTQEGQRVPIVQKTADSG